MAKPAVRKKPPKENIEAINKAWDSAGLHPVLSYLVALASHTANPETPLQKDAFAQIDVTLSWSKDPKFNVELNGWKRLETQEWLHVIGQALLSLAMNHTDPEQTDTAWHRACEIIAADLTLRLAIGKRPDAIQAPNEAVPRQTPQQFAAVIRDHLAEAAIKYGHCGLAGAGQAPWHFSSDVKLLPKKQRTLHEDALASGIRNSLSKTLAAVDNSIIISRQGAAIARFPNSMAERARSWFIANYPLLASLAAGFDIAQDAELCARYDIQIAAVDSEQRLIYINPKFPWTESGMRFVMAHELLHVGLRHEARRQGRQHFLWNIACDYVINAWLMEMGVGELPADSLMLDLGIGFESESAEALYDRIVKDLRLMRRLQKERTLRGIGLGDMMCEKPPSWWSGPGCDLDSFYRRALAEGLDLHLQSRGRGTLPGDMIEEIRAIQQPPIPWDVKLGQWLDGYFPPIEARRSFSRASRRQSSTPEIPRAVYLKPEELLGARTFGVVLDTSGSVSDGVLARGLGAIASYAMSREVPRVRILHCDAGYKDLGYIAPESLLDQRVAVHGRGGTVLMPAIQRLAGADDFPNDAPVLIITDGACDVLTISRAHAYLMPEGCRLPFVARGPEFHIEMRK